MTTTTLTYNRGPSFFGVITKILLFLVLAFAVGTAISHAVERHGTETLSIRQCFDNGQSHWKWLEDGNEIQCLRVNTNEFWFRVIHDGQELTIYRKGSIRSVQDLLNFVKSRAGEWIK